LYGGGYPEEFVNENHNYQFFRLYTFESNEFIDIDFPDNFRKQENFFNFEIYNKRLFLISSTPEIYIFNIQDDK